MQMHGYRIIPVNPTAAEILGEKAYPSLDAVPVPYDAVDIFRPSADVPPIVEQAIKGPAKVIWMQLGIRNEGAAQKADRKSTRLNSSHSQISYAVFCLKKKTI